MLSQVFVVDEMLITNKVSVIESDDKSIEKYRKLLKTGKLFKSWKSAKSRKKLLKSGNLSNFKAKKNRPNFLSLNTRTTFNCL